MYCACCLAELTLETSVMDKARKERHIWMPKVFRKLSLYEGHRKKFSYIDLGKSSGG